MPGDQINTLPVGADYTDPATSGVWVAVPNGSVWAVTRVL
jgi:hypothetical protein